jgi:FSR family fosmidomycin resistance protein-like MFS transporter
MTLAASAAPRFERVTLSVLVAVSVCHMLNDIMQSLLGSR